jgi:lipid-A-disaccharide synthase
VAQRIFISAGEASGDLYGSLLIEALRGRLGEAEFRGCGGDRMRAAGCRTLVDAKQVAMVGLVEVVPGLPRAWRALRKLRDTVRKDPPALAILIDFPDFNLRLAKELKRAGTPVVYFVAPQVWAWRPGRVKTIRRYVDRLLCIFPFEEKFFQAAQIPAEFVGHPLVGRAAPAFSSREFRARFGLPETKPLIALLPGSRRREILLNLLPLIETAHKLAAKGDYCFLIPAASTVAGEWLRARVANVAARSGSDGSAFHIIERHTYDALAHAEAAVVASGTATIETALLGTPMVVVYRVSGLTWWLGRNLVQTPFYSMVNLVAGRPIVPEFIQDQFQPEVVARAVLELINSAALRDTMRKELRGVAEELGRPLGETGTEGNKILDPIQRAVAVAEFLLQETGGWTPQRVAPRVPA